MKEISVNTSFSLEWYLVQALIKVYLAIRHRHIKLIEWAMPFNVFINTITQEEKHAFVWKSKSKAK